LELYYQAVQQELNNQGLLIAITGFIRQIEAYITEQCTSVSGETIFQNLKRFA